MMYFTEARKVIGIREDGCGWATYEMDLERPETGWQRLEDGSMPTVASQTRAEQNMNAWARDHGLIPAGCVPCWHLTRDNARCRFFRRSLSSLPGTCIPLRCADCREWGCMPPG